MFKKKYLFIIIFILICLSFAFFYFNKANQTEQFNFNTFIGIVSNLEEKKLFLEVKEQDPEKSEIFDEGVKILDFSFNNNVEFFSYNEDLVDSEIYFEKEKEYLKAIKNLEDISDISKIEKPSWRELIKISIDDLERGDTVTIHLNSKREIDKVYLNPVYKKTDEDVINVQGSIYGAVYSLDINSSHNSIEILLSDLGQDIEIKETYKISKEVETYLKKNKKEDLFQSELKNYYERIKQFKGDMNKLISSGIKYPSQYDFLKTNLKEISIKDDVELFFSWNEDNSEKIIIRVNILKGAD